MLDLINQMDTALRPIDGLHCGYLAAPHLKAACQVVTVEKSRRILRAIELAV
jgi:hypothetical protein